MLTDQSKMPFGKYVAEPLIEVPASYLLWLEGEINKKPGMRHSMNEKDVLRYIDENRNFLQKESRKQY